MKLLINADDAVPLCVHIPWLMIGVIARNGRNISQKYDGCDNGEMRACKTLVKRYELLIVFLKRQHLSQVTLGLFSGMFIHESFIHR